MYLFVPELGVNLERSVTPASAKVRKSFLAQQGPVQKKTEALRYNHKKLDNCMTYKHFLLMYILCLILEI